MVFPHNTLDYYLFLFSLYTFNNSCQKLSLFKYLPLECVYITAFV